MAEKTKRALLIGIDRYPKLSKFSQLKGAVNDVNLMEQLLLNHFKFDHTTKLTAPSDEEAYQKAEADGTLPNQANIRTAFQEFADSVEKDDIVVIHFAGHGSQMRDREGDEPDGWDSTIMPCDSGRKKHPNLDITDDEISLWVQQISEQTDYLTLLFDCCHSGSITRDEFGEASRYVEPDERGIDELPPSPVPDYVERMGKRKDNPSGWTNLGENYLLISGCRHDESSYEYHDVEQDVRHGALTYYLARAFTNANGKTTYRDIFERVNTQVTTNNKKQHPQIEGARDRVIFGTDMIEPMKFVPVNMRKDMEKGGKTVSYVQLAGGAALGVTKDSIYSIFEPSTKEESETDKLLGKIKIVQVKAVTATGIVTEEKAPGAIKRECRAVLDAYSPGTMQQHIAIQAPEEFKNDADRLRNLIDKSKLLKAVDEGEPANYQAYILPPRGSHNPVEAQEAGMPVPQLDNFDKPTWAVIGKDGKLAMPLHTTDERDVIKILFENFEKLAKYQMALGLENPDPGHVMNGKIDFALLRKVGDDDWEEIEPNEGGELIVYEGDQLGARVTNRHTAPVHINILDFGISGAVSPLYPIPGYAKALEPNKPFDVMVRYPEELGPMYFPDNFPFVTDRSEEPPYFKMAGGKTDPRPLEGLEHFKLFATTHPADFNNLKQEATRSSDPARMEGGDSPLGQLLNMAYTGAGTRDAKPKKVRPQEEWTTVTRSFILRKSDKPKMEDEGMPDWDDIDIEDSWDEEEEASAPEGDSRGGIAPGDEMEEAGPPDDMWEDTGFEGDGGGASRGGIEPGGGLNDLAGAGGGLGGIDAGEAIPEPAPPAPSPSPAPAPEVDEDVQFTVYRPEIIKPGEWHDMLAYAHIADLIDQVEAQAAEALGEQMANFRDRTDDARIAIPKEAILRFVPQVEGVVFNPPERSFMWLEELQEEKFRLKAKPEYDGKTVRGALTVYMENMVVADVSLRMKVSSTEEPETTEPKVTEKAKPYRKIFISYSHDDMDVVKEVEHYATLLGDEYIRDWSHLKAGENWSDRLYEFIDQADVFQLFWSHNSKDSKFVEQEIKYALNLGRDKFVRPVYWETEPFPSPPEYLGMLHFQKIELKNKPAAPSGDENEP